jgi:hypothetical protein
MTKEDLILLVDQLKLQVKYQKKRLKRRLDPVRLSGQSQLLEEKERWEKHKPHHC